MPSVTSRLKKNIVRTKQKILQGMGLDVNRTNDQNFDMYAQQFEQQHKQASKLTHDLNKYLNCLKETQRCSKAFYDTLKETYENNWPDSNLFYDQIQMIEFKWMDYLTRLNNDVQLPLIAYSNEFPELKKKIDKRANRLIDYDNAKQALLAVQNKTTKHSSNNTNGNSNNGTGKFGIMGGSSSKSNEIHSTENLTKLTKLKIDLEDKQHIYDEINQTLCMSLPVLYENRIKFYSSLFQTFFHTETMFYSDCAEIKSKLDNLCEMLSNKTITPHPTTTSNLNNENDEVKNPIESNIIVKSNTNDYDANENDESNDDSSDSNSNNNTNNVKSNDLPNLTISSPNTANKIMHLNGNTSNNGKYENESDLNSSLATNYYTTRSSNTVPSNHNNNSSFNYLYKVKAAYGYTAKELDELTFAKDDSIQVLEGTESEKEDLDDGWLIGLHENTNKRGIFPENFTKRI